MVGVRQFPEGYTGAIEALVDWCGVGKGHTHWREPLTNAYEEAVEAGQESFTYRVPIAFGNFRHPRYFTEVTFQTSELCTLDNFEGAFGIHETAKEKFKIVARSAIPDNPKGYIDFREVAERFKDDADLARMTDLKKSFEELLREIKEYIEAILQKRAGKAERENAPEDVSITLPRFFSRHGILFETKDFMYCFYDKQNETDREKNNYNLYVRDDPEVLSLLRSRFIHTYNQEYALQVKDMEYPNESYGEILGMPVYTHRLVKIAVEQGYIDWQVNEKLAREKGEPATESFEAIIPFKTKSGEGTENVLVTVPVSECGFYRHLTGCDFGMTKHMIRNTIVTQIPLKWFTHYNADLPDTELESINRPNLRKLVRGLLVITDASKSDYNDLTTKAVNKTHEIFEKLLPESQANGSVVNVEGVDVDLSKDVKFSRGSITYSISMSGKLIRAIVENVVQEKGKPLANSRG